MYDNGRNGSRARAARIRSSHDYEANTLDAMRRRSGEPQRPGALTCLAARLRQLVARGAEARRDATRERGELVPRPE